ncbi:extracellular solute-binding protein [Streptomyces albus]|uniref:extracellular solute-binding protein n=1 Tax=Streptomyces albus TaxID=1888 RepID=UPI0033CD329B
MPPPTESPIGRRALLRTGAGLTAALAAGPLLTACGDGGTAARPGVRSEKLLPSTTVRNAGVEPDLPGTADGVPPGFFRYPAQPRRSVEGRPLAGAEPVSAVMETFAPPPAGRDRNAAWQAIERRLGGTVDLTAVPADDYPSKFSTMIAANHLPDLFMYPETGGVDNMAGFLDATCADLTPFLAGDRIRRYPNLAAVPKDAWRKAVYNGKLYGIPITRGITGGAGFYRHDLFAEAGVTDLDQITGLDRFVELCKELTRPAEDRYAIMASVTNLLAMSAGAPYLWRMDARTGKFTADLETDEYRFAVETARKLQQAGCFYPGSLGMSGAQKARYTDMFKNGKAAYVYDGMPPYLTPGTGYVATMAAVDKKYDPRPMIPFGPEAVAWTDNLSLSTTFVKKAPATRVEQLLALADFVAAPFGSEEYTLINYGVEGTDFTRDRKGNPVLTKRGTQDVAAPWKMLASTVPAVFSAESAAGVRHVHAAYTKLIPMLAPDPALTVFSPTWEAKGTGSLYTLKQDGLKDIVSGREPMSAYDDLVKEYLAKGAEKARAEFEEALQKGKR